MKIALGSDDKTSITDSIYTQLDDAGHEITQFGPIAGAQEYWPAVARQVAEAVISGRCDEGILLCWTGTGVSMAANKVTGVRAALCVDAQTARGARMWNNANVLCLSLRLSSAAVAHEILDAWFETSYLPNQEDDACLAQLEALEQAYHQHV